MKGIKNYANFIMLLTMAIIGMGFFVRIGGTVPTSLVVVSRPVIVLDAGHGGMDGGAVGVDGIVEKNINLAIAQKLQTLLVLGGFDVVMTRDTDTSIHDEGISGIRKQKVSDMNNRLKTMKDYPGAVFVSIHQNQFTASQFHGAQMFYSPNNSSSKELAQTVQNKIRSGLDPENNREIKEAGDDLFLLRYAPTTAIIAECGFLSNPAEACKLADDEYQSKLAFAIYSAIVEHCGTPEI